MCNRSGNIKIAGRSIAALEKKTAALEKEIDVFRKRLRPEGIVYLRHTNLQCNDGVSTIITNQITSGTKKSNGACKQGEFAKGEERNWKIGSERRNTAIFGVALRRSQEKTTWSNLFISSYLSLRY